MDYPDCHAHSPILRLINVPFTHWISSQGVEDWEVLKQIDRGNGLVFIGLHPWELGSADGNDLIRLDELLKENPHLALGEIGLDRGKRGRPWDKQESLFLRQVELAKKYSRPICLHIHKAWQDLYRLTPELGRELSVMIHGFNQSPELAEQLVKRGYYLSLPWGCRKKGDLWLKKILKVLPPHKLLSESDYTGSPPLTYQAYKKNMEDLYKGLARAGGKNPIQWKEQVERNIEVFKNEIYDGAPGREKDAGEKL